MSTRTFLSVLIVAGIFSSCKKTSSTTPETVTKPRVGTIWTYRYKTFDGSGIVVSTNNIVYKATSAQTLGGEQWINITDSVNATVFLLNVKTGGLYQYANSASNLFCKYPAAVNDTYNTYNSGGAETFTVSGVDILVSDAPMDDVKVNRYDGVKSGNLTDQVWYNENLWIMKMEKFAPNLMGVYQRNKRWELLSIVY